jgi:DNA-binding protein YbaB
MRAEIEAMLKEYRDMRARLATLTSDLAALTATAHSTDGLVRATVNPHGNLVDLEIDERAVARSGMAALVPSILEATGRASTEVRAKARTAMRGFLPDWMDDVLKADGTVNVAALLPGDPTARAEARRR